MKRNRDISIKSYARVSILRKHSIDFMTRTVEPLNPLKEHRHALRQAKFETVCTLRRYAFIPHLCVWRARRAFDTPYVMHLAHSRGLSPPRIFQTECRKFRYFYPGGVKAATTIRHAIKSATSREFVTRRS